MKLALRSQNDNAEISKRRRHSDLHMFMCMVILGTCLMEIDHECPRQRPLARANHPDVGPGQRF